MFPPGPYLAEFGINILLTDRYFEVGTLKSRFLFTVSKV